MNPQLQSILEKIQNDNSLTESEKELYIKSLKEIDKKQDQLQFKMERFEKDRHTLSVMLEESIEDLQKKSRAIEAQNRELEIEASLERVRAVAMSMMKPEDMLDVCKTIARQLDILHVKEIRNVQTAIFYEEKSTYMNYEFYAKHDKVFITETDYRNHPVAEKFGQEMLKGPNKVFIHQFNGKEVSDWLDYQKTTNVFIDTNLETAGSLTYYWYSLGPVALGISTYHPLSEEEINLFKRFRNVFELAYRRYLDIEKAEAQAREAQIQLALERVRARTMAMQHSSELAETAAVLFEQFYALGEMPERMAIEIVNEDEHVFDIWATDHGGKQMNLLLKVSLDEPHVMQKMYAAWKTQTKSITIDLQGKELEEYFQFLKDRGLPVNRAIFGKRRVQNVATFSKGILTIITPEPRPQETIDILERFAAAFDGTYTRFLDLKKAEAQARESQIQLALERVRSRAMAMQSSEELKALIGTLFTELTKLDLVLTRCIIWVFESTSNAARWWMANSEEPSNPLSFYIKYHEHPAYLTFVNGWKDQNVKFVYDLKGQDKINWDNILFNETELKHLPDVVKDGMQTPNRVLLSASFNNFGGINVASLEPLSDEQFEILLRFAKVFDLTYTRFLDLKKAEAQAREAEIQLALERVRARTMAMQKQNDLLGVLDLLVGQLIKLGVHLEVANFSNKIPGGDWDLWIEVVSDDGTIFNNYVHFPRIDHPYFNRVEKNIETFNSDGTDLFKDVFSKEEKDSWQDYILTQTIYKDIVPEKHKQIIYDKTGYTWSLILLKETWVSICRFNTIPFSNEEDALFRRFANTFGQAYTRFLDLQKAEAQARESQIQLALERVRARTMAMQKSEELQETTLILFQQFKSLGATTAQVSICIFDEEVKMGEMFLTVNGEKIDSSFPMELDKEVFVMKKAKYAFLNREKTFVCTVEGKELQRYNHWRNSLVGKKNWDESDAVCKKSWYVNAIFFSSGMMGISSDSPATEEAVKLLERFAGVFDLTFTRFLDLKKAEAQARESQIETALEKVRSRSLAMNHSNELEEVVGSLFDRLVELGLSFDGAFIFLFEKETKNIQLWIATTHLSAPARIDMPYDKKIENNTIIKDLWHAIENGEHILNRSYSGKIKNDYFRYVAKYNGSKIPESIKQLQIERKSWTAHFVAEKNSIIGFDSWSGKLISDEDFQILVRFARVFEQAYTRFLDLQKAEAQAREAQIEASLERVRSRSMGMQKSEELKQVIQIVYEQFVHLKIKLDHAGFVVDYIPKGDWHFWIADKQQIPSKITHPYFDSVWANQFNEAKEKRIDSFATNLNFEQKNKFYTELLSYVPGVPEEAKQFYLNSPGVAASTALADNVSLYIENFSGIPYSDEENKILIRFCKVFEQTYIRFLDLQKAEAQARESQIQLALERVRARTMAMYKSNELQEVAEVLFQQLLSFGGNILNAGIALCEMDADDDEYWASSDTGIRPMIFIPHTEDSIQKRLYEGWKNKLDFYSESKAGDELKAHYDYMASVPALKPFFEEGASNRPVPTWQKWHAAYFSHGYIFLLTADEYGEEKILIRFAKIFEQAYIRFQDLQKAEAQARESQIQLALERVRARTMAMQKSDELSEAVYVLFQQFKELGENPDQATIGIINEEEKVIEYWVTMYGNPINKVFKFSIEEPNVTAKIYKAWKENKKSLVIDLSGKALSEFMIYRAGKGGAAVNPDEKRRIINVAFFSKGLLNVQSNKERSEESIKLLERFAAVFEQTYTRFLDLQKSEAQARESQIEAALERVRSKTMAMHNSNDVGETVAAMFAEFVHLGIITNRCGILIFTDEKSAEVWTARSTAEGKAKLIIGKLDLEIHPMLSSVGRAWKAREAFYQYELADKDIIQYYTAINNAKFYPTRFDLNALPPKEFHSDFFFTDGAVFSFTNEPVAEEFAKIMKRFAAVFGQTYRRYLDLQKAEAQAREAQIEAALEKVRSRSLAMHKSDELQKVINTVHDHLIELDVKMDSASFFIFYEGRRDVDLWLAAPEHIYSSRMHIPYIDYSPTKEFFDARERGDDFFTMTCSFEEKNRWLNYAFEYTDLKQSPPERRKLLLEAECWTLSWAISRHSAVQLSSYSRKSFSDTEHDILKRFAKVFEQAYVRFLDLQKAEAQARESQIQLALERVRARTMAMQKSDELSETAQILFQQFMDLGESPIQITIGIVNELKDSIEFSVTDWGGGGAQVNRQFNVDVHEPTLINKIYKAWKEQKTSLVVDLSGDELDDWINYRNTISGVNVSSNDTKGRRVITNAFFSKGHISFSTPEPRPQETVEILERFAGTFDLTYTRFLDLQKAEAQTKESQIQLALERVRARTMAMHNSSELAEVASVIFEQLSLLGASLWICGFNICKKDSEIVEGWISPPDGKVTEPTYIPYTADRFSTSAYEAWKYQKPIYVDVIGGIELKESHEELMRQPFMAKVRNYVIENGFAIPTWVQRFAVPYRFGYLMIVTTKPFEETGILLRFSKVFEQTYTRFLDLQRAEAQAKEAQIEAALERVRSRAMAMQSSDELASLVGTVFAELTRLDLTLTRCAIWIFDPDTQGSTRWIANSEDPANPMRFYLPYNTFEPYLAFLEQWKRRSIKFEYELSGTTKRKWDDYLFNETEYSKLPAAVIAGMKAPDRVLLTASFNNFGALNAASLESLSDDHFDILLRFAKVFDLTYTRFNDLKQAEAQAREAQIQLALERVRASTMAMHNSDDVSTATATMFTELERLGIENFRGGINTIHSNRTQEVWSVNNLADKKVVKGVGAFDIDAHPFWQLMFREWEAKKDSLYYFLAGEEKEEYIKILNATRGYLTKPIENFPDVYFQVYFFNEGTVWTNSLQPHSEEDKQIMKRFASVFSLTFRRYRDLQKAESQARESQIEASLERVRSKTMAMHNSHDVGETVAVMFDELKKLGIETIRCGIGIMHEQNNMEIWTARPHESGKTDLIIGHMDMRLHALLQGAFNGWSNKQESFSYELKGDDLVNYFNAINKHTEYPVQYDISTLPSIIFHNDFYFSEGTLFAFTTVPLSEEFRKIFKRFAGVFGQTYRRYLDLQKAEAQAREATIEAALERVRYRAMAMQTSKDVGEATSTMFSELDSLGIETFRCGIAIVHMDQMEVWSIGNTGDGKTVKGVGTISPHLHPLWIYFTDEWKKKTDITYYYLTGKEKEDYVKIITNLSTYSLTNDNLQFPDLHFQSFYFEEGGVFTFSLHPFSEADKQVMKRFTSVFSLTFRRYKDLEKAEAQAREAQIEAALERVRAKAMAMQNSNDLSVAASMVFTELRRLGISPIRCGVGLLNKESHRAQLYSATSSENGDSLSLVGWAQMENHSVLEKIYDAWLNGEDYFPELEGNQLQSYYQLLLAGFSVPVPDFTNEQKQYGHFISFSVGCLYAWSDVSYSEDQIKIFKRFAAIVDLTFRRYLELQNSEANTKEAIKQAALDRIRADIASMRTVSDLDRITPLIWNELTVLGINFIRCGVFIMDDSQKLIHTFLSTPDGKAIGAFHLPYDTPGNFAQIVHNWKQKELYVDHWSEFDFISLADILVKQGAIASREQYLNTLPHGGFYLHFLPFLQGMLYVGNTVQLGEEEIKLLQAVADAFSTAYARYEDFNKLEAAKQQIEETLVDLKQAQTQLVQSEKMASLGELTAGIAHEIQNPLNFVNNFSEVNKELLAEMNDEIEKGNFSEVKLIASDIIGNQEKINFHGKRADAIVKGMLQHSRSSTGQQELTDINTLCDEYVRLAYHGLRAKDKSFNAKFETSFDKNIGKINIVPQDIGRVILNLINNAFYAVTEKRKQNISGYEPTVRVHTKKINDKPDSYRVEIKVSDNGNGIPQKIVDKIFQPFFTTKPTGSGTGLGLSLSYDIIKAHGGEIKVETRENEGSEFIIQLPNHSS